MAMDINTLTTEELQTRSYYEQHATDWSQRRKQKNEPSFWQDEFNEFQKIRTPHGTVLEIGSGAGREALELMKMGYDYIGIESSPSLLKVAKEAYPTIKIFLATPYDLPLAPESVDAFFSWAMLPHVPKGRIKLALEVLKRVLKGDGIGFIAMREGSGYRKEEKTGRWFAYYTQEEFATILQELGFQILKQSKKQSRPDLVWLTFFVRKPTHS